uniref:Cytochrome c oxidase subunit 3 n=2 Tax=Arctica islandica TaxID=59239 RepID=U5L3R9_ARCIS|nr:cytochrome c oxidase subunit III [Arctica islandica]AGW53593.1 cytochrome oxidase subunit III [Arctica islandica]
MFWLTSKVLVCSGTSNLLCGRFDSVYFLLARTGYHLVDVSPWPISAALSALGLTSAFIGLAFEGGSTIVEISFICSLVLLILTLIRWWGDVIVESTFLGCHTSLVVRNLRIGMLLFILSEIFFFVSFFWAFFYVSIGELSSHGVSFWPPMGTKAIYPWKVPFLNTAVLLGSGATVTWAHNAVSAHNLDMENNKSSILINKKWWIHGLLSLGITVGLGVFFTWLQFNEYYMSSFSMADSVYGSVFFMMTGFHGMHVLVGTVFLLVCWFRLYLHHFSFHHHYFGLDAAVWYWHFVDIVWIGLFSFVYVWGY